VQPLWKTGWSFLKKLKIELPYDLAIPLLGSARECVPGYNRATCTSMFIATLFTIIKLENSPDAPQLMNELKNMIHTHTHTHTKCSFIQP
jgi:hypothetical protein